MKKAIVIEAISEIGKGLAMTLSENDYRVRITLTNEPGGLDLLVISSGTGDLNEDLNFETKKEQ